MTDPPPNLPTCDPRDRFFPIEWKESFYRRNFDSEANGYKCPGCDEIFRGTAGLKMLHADHVIPFSKGGLTVWSNLVLLCGPCNIAKGASGD